MSLNRRASIRTFAITYDSYGETHLYVDVHLEGANKLTQVQFDAMNAFLKALQALEACVPKVFPSDIGHNGEVSDSTKD